MHDRYHAGSKIKYLTERSSERRTRVTDDDSDYFSAGSVWLNSAERDKLNKYQQELHDKKHASRLSKKMTFDFGGKCDSHYCNSAECYKLNKY